MKKMMILLLMMLLLAVSSWASQTGITPDTSMENHVDKAGNDPGMENIASSTEMVTLELTAVGLNKIKVIKAVREVTPLELKKAKELVESAPAILIEKISRADAEKIKEKFEKLGAKVTIKKI